MKIWHITIKSETAITDSGNRYIEFILGYKNVGVMMSIDTNTRQWHSGLCTLTLAKVRYDIQYGWCMNWWKYFPILGIRKKK